MDITQLQSSVLFSQMTPQQIQTALNDLTYYEKDYCKEDLILAAGDSTEYMGFVETGSVSIENNDFWGNRTILNLIQAGGFFAETYAYIKDSTLLVDAVANTDCRILFLRISSLHQIDPQSCWLLPFLRNFLRISSQKNLHLSGRSFHTAPKSARDRIRSYLYSVSLQKHADEFDIPFDRQQLADYLNLERTALSKELGKMRKDGLIECKKNHFKLLTDSEL